MFARRDGRLEMGGPEAGRRGQDGVIDARQGQHLLVSVKAAETLVLRQAEVLHALPGGLGEDISHPENLAFHTGGFGRFHEIPAGAAAASA